MRTRIRPLLTLGALLVALAAVVLLLTSQAAAAPGHALPVAPAEAIAAPPAQTAGAGIMTSNVPASTCTLSGTVRTCDLWAMTGTITMPTGNLVPIWGFADNATGPAQLPGPTLVGNVGETLEVVLHNQLLTETVSLAFPGQQGHVADLTGIPAGPTSTVTYTLPLTPGTFLYEAGMTPNGVIQVAMGMYGPLIVRPVTPTQAYMDPVTTFQDEALLVLGEIDPVFHSDPYAFEMSEYRPVYWHINGKAYPQTDEILTGAGRTVLLRLVNGGLMSHWMTGGGLRVRTIASDGHERFPTHLSLVEHVSAGMTLDITTTVPLSATGGMLYPVYDANLLLHNAGQRLPSGELAYGGMMTFMRVVTGTTGPLVGPLVSNVLVSPNPTTGAAGVTLSAQFPPGVSAAEFFTNTVGAEGSGVQAIPDGTGAATWFIDAPTLATWPSGFIVFYVRGQDANGWGPVGSTILNLDYLGPKISGMSLAPEPSNGSRPVLLRATGDDHSTGRNNVVAATYAIDGGAAAPMFLARTDSPITAMTATLTITTLQGLAEGLHPIAVTAEDTLGNLGVPGVITLTMDRTGPTVPSILLTPDLLDLTGAVPVTSIRLDASITDDMSLLANAEAFINPTLPITPGTGFDLFPTDGLFDEMTEGAYFDIPVANFLYLDQGWYPISVHGLDVAGNWGVLATDYIFVDRGLPIVDGAGPVVSELSVFADPLARATSLDLTAAVADPELLSTVAGAEWFVDTDPGEGAGMPLQAVDGVFDHPAELLVGTIDTSGWTGGSHTLYVRALDSSGNWGAVEAAAIDTQERLLIYLPTIRSRY